MLLLEFKRQSTPAQLLVNAGLMGRFKQNGSEGPMNRDRGIDDRRRNDLDRVGNR